VIEGDVAEALRALDARLAQVCDVEEARAQRMSGAERGWDSLRAALAPPAAELAYAPALDEAALCPAHGPSALVRARRELGLDALELDALVILLAPHVEPRYARVYTALQDDGSHGLVVERLLYLVLGRSPARARRLAASLAEGGRLVESGLVSVAAGAYPANGRPIDLAPDVRDAILDLPPPRLVAGIELAWSPPCGPAPSRLGAVVHGPGERLDRARALVGGSHVIVRVDRPLGSPLEAAALRAAWRIAALRGAVPIFDLGDAEPHVAVAAADHLTRWLRCYGGSAVLATRAAMPVALPHHLAPALSYAQRRATWIDGAAAAGAAIDDATAARLATNLRLGRQEVAAVFATTGSTDVRGLSDAAQRLARVAVRHGHRVPAVRGFADLVVRDTTRAALERLAHFADARDRIAEDRGLEARFRLQRGPIVLFSGRSGTGKTLAAEVLATTLGRPLYVVDLSRLVSKYIGETEKHIDEALSSGERAGAILFFDEADSLFATRTEVSSSNDRFANLEVGYLLQRIEHHDGLVILATNLQHSIDEAFLRRFHARIEFPFPEVDERRQIWELMLQSCAGSELDLPAIARAHRLSGGDIRNAALKAIFLAERDGRPLGQADLDNAVALELYELGRLSRRNGSREATDAGARLREFAHAIEAVLEHDLRRRFMKEVHIIHGSPTKETLAGRRPAVSIAIYRIASGGTAGMLRLGVIVSAWSQRAEEEHEMLGVLLEVLSAAAWQRHTVRVQQSFDFDLLHRFWSSHGHPVRASLVLDVELR
jgi:DNA polymerase III delta prime subunit